MNELAAHVSKLPPVVRALPEMPAFLAHLQKLAFFMGVTAVCVSINTETEAPTEASAESSTEKEGQ